MDDVNRDFSSWLRSPGHTAWLMQEGNRLLAFAKASKLPQGFGNLDDHGRLPADAVAETMNTARMTHSFAMAHINGIPGCAALVDHGIAAQPGIPLMARTPTCMPSLHWRPARQSSLDAPAHRRCWKTRFR
jgi:sulfoquinovose isomerase